MKFVVITCPEYTVYIEPCDFGHVVHADIHVRWTKDIKRRLSEDFLNFRRLYRRPLYAAHYPEQGTKHKKFLKQFDFHPLMRTKDGDGIACWLWETAALI